MADGSWTLCHKPSAITHGQRQFVAVGAAGLNVNVTSFDSFAPIVTLCVIGPSFSCHASIVYVPGGRFGSSNFPSSFVTAKYGCGRTPTYAFIQPCTSHLNGTITSGLSKVCDIFMPWIGWPLLNSEFAFGIAWMLWSVGSLLRISSVWPTRMPNTCG